MQQSLFADPSGTPVIDLLDGSSFTGRSRPYQRDCLANTLRLFANGTRRQLWVMATGGGKTVTLDMLIAALGISNERGNRAFVMAHRRKLVHQARNSIQRFTGLHVDIEMGDRKVSDFTLGRSPVIVSSIHTMMAPRNRGGQAGFRYEKFDPLDAKLLFIDEAHRSRGAKYDHFINWMAETNPGLLIVGATATPIRTDGKGLGAHFDAVSYEWPAIQGILGGWLVDADFHPIVVECIDFGEIPKSGNDLNREALAKRLMEERPLHAVVLGMLGELTKIRATIGRSPRTLVFCANQAHTDEVASLINAYASERSEYAWAARTQSTHSGKPEAVCNEIQEDHAEGQYPILCNCSQLTEGYDDTRLDAVALARPIRNPNLLVQIVGRALRPLGGVLDGLEEASDLDRLKAIRGSLKPRAYVLDCMGRGSISMAHGGNMLGGDFTLATIEAVNRNLVEQRQSKSVLELYEEAQARRDAADQERSGVLASSIDYYCDHIEDAISTSQRLPETSGINSHDADIRDVRSEPATSPQKKLLRTFGYPLSEVERYSKKQATQKIGLEMTRRKHKLCSGREAANLKRLGVQANNYTPLQARAVRRLIDTEFYGRRPDLARVQQVAANPQLYLQGTML